MTLKVEEDGRVTATGPKGTIVKQLSPEMNIAIENGQVLVTRPTDQDRHRALHGLTRTLVNNMITGVSKGYERVLNVTGDHQTVIKNLGRLYRNVQIVSGATILGDGTVAPILDLHRVAQNVIREATMA